LRPRGSGVCDCTAKRAS